MTITIDKIIITVRPVDKENIPTTVSYENGFITISNNKIAVEDISNVTEVITHIRNIVSSLLYVSNEQVMNRPSANQEANQLHTVPYFPPTSPGLSKSPR